VKINQIKFYLKRIYLLGLNKTKQESIVWNNLKKLHEKSNWNFGVFEKEKYIETIFEMEKGSLLKFYYMLIEDQIYFRSRMFENFPEEITTEIFILASHFNNILNDVGVIINTDNRYVEYNVKREMLITLLYPGEINKTTNFHFNLSNDIYYSFKRLIEENESPAIIIADLLNNLKNKSSK
jgi:hypothetical protein